MNALMKGFLRLHTAVLRMSGGKLMAMGGHLLILNSTGAKTGEPRSNPLMRLPYEGGGWLLAASNAGAEAHPGWYYNLKKNPDCTVEVDGVTTPMRARIAEGEERDALWQRFLEFDERFRGYQEKASRKIPVVVLEPRG